MYFTSSVIANRHVFISSHYRHFKGHTVLVPVHTHLLIQKVSAQSALTVVIHIILKTNLPLSFLAGLLIAKALLQGQRESLCREQQLHGLQSCTKWQQRTEIQLKVLFQINIVSTCIETWFSAWYLPSTPLFPAVSILFLTDSLLLEIRCV